MSTLHAARKLLLGETWALPLGIAAVVLTAVLLVRPLAASAWASLGGFAVLLGVIAVLAVSLRHGPRRR